MNKIIAVLGHWFSTNEYKRFNEILNTYPHIRLGEFLEQLELQRVDYRLVDNEMNKLIYEDNTKRRIGE